MYNFVIRCTIHYMTLREDSQQYYCMCTSWCILVLYTLYRTDNTAPTKPKSFWGLAAASTPPRAALIWWQVHIFRLLSYIPDWSKIELKWGTTTQSPLSIYYSWQGKIWGEGPKESQVHKSVLIHETWTRTQIRLPVIIRMSTGTRAMTRMTKPVFFATSMVLLMWW